LTYLQGPRLAILQHIKDHRDSVKALEHGVAI